MKPVIITTKMERRKRQPYSVTIKTPGGGPLIELRERYGTLRNAKRGALRKLKAWRGSITDSTTAVIGRTERPIIYNDL
jgi:hypothetical protein